VTAGTAIAAPPVVPPPGSGKGVVPTAVTNKAWKADSITGIGNVNTGNGSARNVAA
jgi:hypothetical protein